MKLRIGVYNVEWMARLFDAAGQPIQAGQAGVRSTRLATVVKKMNPDIIGIVEGPDTKVDGSRTASKQLEKWATLHGLSPHYKGVHGFPSPGRQELCVLYRSDKVKVQFKPEKKKAKQPFNEPFLVDTTDSLIKERYKHYRSPLELAVTKVGQNSEMARIIVAHTKSKAIFDNVDFARFEQLSERNRKKLYAECLSIRNRCDQWLSDQPDRSVIVMGDINDGAGMDHFERRFRRSAVEILLGDVWEPDLLLQHVLPKPKIGSKGWSPYSSDFVDKLTEYRVNVLIDHILVSRGTKYSDPLVWNPRMSENKNNQAIQSIKSELNTAADHYPVSIVVDL